MPTHINLPQKIVKTCQPRVEVLAGPGSGKTTTLLQRIEHLAAKAHPVGSILVLGFSNATVSELRRRVVELGTMENTTVTAKKSKLRSRTQVVIDTAHAFAFDLARRFNSSITVLEEKSALKLLTQAIKLTLKDLSRRNLTISSDCPQIPDNALRELRDSPRNIRLLLDAVAYARATNLPIATTVSTDQFVALNQYVDVVTAIACRYAKLKEKHGKVDFGDMLTLAIRRIRHDMQWNTYTHVLVDEYQDCSPAQTALLVAMADKGCEIMVFGDPDQSIYGFGGNRYIPLKNAMDGVVQMSLRVSWRLTRQTAAFASSIAQHTKELAIVSARDGPFPELIHTRDLTTQTCSVVNSIRKLIAEGTSPMHIAVLARTRALLKPVEQHLLAKGVQTNQLGTDRDTKHPLRVLHLTHLVERFAASNTSIDPAAVQNALKSVKTVRAINWQQLARNLQKAARMPSVEGRYRKCADWYLRCLGGVRANATIQHDLNRWAPICRGRANARAVRSAIRATSQVPITTSTIHAAKGREWDHVFLVGVADGQLPLHLARDELILAEERRLLFVAVTRAREAVRLYYAPAVHSLSRKRFESLSRFLTDKKVQRRLKTFVPVVGVAQRTPNQRNTRNARNAAS